MKKYIYTILCMVLFYFCDEYVDIQPRGEKIGTSLEDVNLLLNQGENLSDLSGQAFGTVNYIPTIINDNIRATAEDLTNMNVISQGSALRFAGEIFLLKDQFYRDSERDGHWGGSYNAIGISNYALGLLEAMYLTDTRDIALKATYQGEAFVHRAFHYFRLVNIYGPHFGLTEAAVPESGVPIITKFGDHSLSIVRNSVEEVYALIVEDLEKAISLLPEQNIRRDRPSKTSAYALLSRVYLHMGDYDKALQNAQATLGIQNTLYDYNTLVGNLRPTKLENVEHVLLKISKVILTGAYPNTYLFNRFSPELEALYEAGDLRRKEFTVYDGSLSFGEANFNRNRRLTVGVTTPELMLIKAECMARQENFSGAMSVLNILRATRYATAVVATNGHELNAANKGEALVHILNERRREFHVNGLRFFDIKRLNAIENAGISITRGGVALAPNSINWAMPIGIDVINNSNGDIKQNKRE